MEKLNLDAAKGIADKIQSGKNYHFNDYQGYSDFFTFDKKKDKFLVEITGFDFQNNESFIVSQKYYDYHEFVDFLLTKSNDKFKSFMNE